MRRTAISPAISPNATILMSVFHGTRDFGHCLAIIITSYVPCAGFSDYTPMVSLYCEGLVEVVKQTDESNLTKLPVFD
jgi:hypothetical protein